MLQYCTQEKKCKAIVCDTFNLKNESTTEFILSGDVHFRDLNQRAAVCGRTKWPHDYMSSGNISNGHALALQDLSFMNRYIGDSAKVKFRSFMKVSFDKQRYVLDSHKKQVLGSFTS